MPLRAPSGSSASLVVKWNNEAAVDRAVRRWAKRMLAELERLRRDRPAWRRAITSGLDLLPVR